jgi:hypothetical protein
MYVYIYIYIYIYIVRMSITVQNLCKELYASALALFPDTRQASVYDHCME